MCGSARPPSAISPAATRDADSSRVEGYEYFPASVSQAFKRARHGGERRLAVLGLVHAASTAAAQAASAALARGFIVVVSGGSGGRAERRPRGFARIIAGRALSGKRATIDAALPACGVPRGPSAPGDQPGRDAGSSQRSSVP